MIERHNISRRAKMFLDDDFEGALDSLKVISEKLTNKEGTPSYLMNSLYSTYIELAAYELFNNNAEELFWKYLLKSVQCCKNFYKLSLSSNEKELIKLDDIGEFELKTGTYINFITPWHYRTHFKLALLAHDNELLAMLARIKEDKFDPEKAGLSGAEFHWAGYRYINEILNSNDETKVKELYEEALKATIEYHEDEGEPYEESSIYFDLEIMKAIREKNSESFNKHLAGRLEAFKAFYGDKTGRSAGLFAPFPTGLAAFAYDQGLEITVESDYMPRFLVEGKYTEEKIKWPMG